MNNDKLLSNLDLLSLDDLDLTIPELNLEIPSFDSDLTSHIPISSKELESIKVNKEDNSINVKFKDIESFINAHGSKNVNLLEKSIKDLIYYYSSHSDTSKEIEDSINFDLSIMDNLKPKDSLEAIMLKQILMTHSVINKCFIRASMNNQSHADKDGNINRTTKLIRAFNSQIKAYIKYSRGGHQKVTVQHVNVKDGGQAIIGNMHKG